MQGSQETTPRLSPKGIPSPFSSQAMSTTCIPPPTDPSFWRRGQLQLPPLPALLQLPAQCHVQHLRDPSDDLNAYAIRILAGESAYSWLLFCFMSDFSGIRTGHVTIICLCTLQAVSNCLNFLLKERHCVMSQVYIPLTYVICVKMSLCSLQQSIYSTALSLTHIVVV